MKAFRLVSILAMSAALSACGIGDWLGGKEETPPLPGKRISVLSYGDALRPDEEAPAPAFAASTQISNPNWPQAGGNPSHVMQNLALSKSALKKAWSADIGEGARKNLPLTAQPVIAGKSIFTLDTDSVLSAFDTETGKKRWGVSVRDKAEKDAVISGGIAENNGLLYVTAGYDELLCVEAASGKIRWRVNLTSPSRAAPTVAAGRVYVTTLVNSLIAMDAANGAVLWEYSGLAANTALIGAASPAVSGDLVVPAFSSGEILALRAGNGSVAWSDNLANALRLGGITALSDIRALPVIEGGTVYAVSYGGKMVAIDLNTGTRRWQKDIGGSKNPWIAGNRIFLITSDGEIAALDKDSGEIAWVSRLAKYKDPEKREGAIIWTGPIMAGDRLLAFSNDSRIAEIDPAKGSLIREWDSGGDVGIAPIVANGTLYILNSHGDLTAWR